MTLRRASSFIDVGAAERLGMRIGEVPVDWVDDPDSRVNIVSTALDDLPARQGVFISRRLIHGSLGWAPDNPQPLVKFRSGKGSTRTS